MTDGVPNADPQNTPAVEHGTIQPGDTPPDAASTEQSANKDPVPKGSRFTSSGVTSLVMISAFAVLFAIIAVLLVVYLWDKFS